jgi:hypothetical protein
MLGTATVSCPSVFGPFILSRSSSRSSTDRTKAVPHLLLRELRGEVLEKLPPGLEIALHCNEHSSQIFRGPPGDKDVSRIPAIHHPLRHVDSRSRYVGMIVNIDKPAYWAAMDTHPHAEFRMTL